MKSFSILSTLLAASIATAASLEVPGDNPLTFCSDPKDFILDVTNVDLSPNPPAAGQNLTITATGTFNDKIEEGAHIQVQVKYGVITIIRQTYDLCELTKNVELECPIEKGSKKLTKDVELPSLIPSGKYSVSANVLTKDEEIITCLQAQVEFHRGDSMQKVLGRMLKV